MSIIQLYSNYLFLTAGRKAYEDLAANLKKGLPSSSTVRNYVSSKRTNEEGKMDFEGLRLYLLENDCPKIVAISEDQTRIWPKIRYDPKTKCLVGFSTPYNQNGLPKVELLKVKSASCIQKCFKKYKKCSYVNVIMAQPLKENVAPFCVGAFAWN